MKVWSAVAAGLLTATSAGAADPDAPKPITLDAATVGRLGVAVAAAQASSQAAVATGFARVLDPTPLAQLDSDITAAGPVARASATEAARTQSLYAADVTVSRKVAEAAASQARGDAARLSLLRRRLGLEWGPAIAKLSDAQRSALVSSLVSGRSALVRVDSAGGAGQSSLRTATIDLGPLGPVTATVLGPARAADPRLQSPGLIARVSGPKAALLSAGLTAPVRLSGGARAGVVVPAGAVLRLHGATWAYVQVRPNAYQRRRLTGTGATPGGVFATGGVRAGDLVVVRGASALHAAEQGGGPAAD